MGIQVGGYIGSYINYYLLLLYIYIYIFVVEFIYFYEIGNVHPFSTAIIVQNGEPRKWETPKKCHGIVGVIGKANVWDIFHVGHPLIESKAYFHPDEQHRSFEGNDARLCLAKEH
jgi:hypothetical protein